MAKFEASGTKSKVIQQPGEGLPSYMGYIGVPQDRVWFLRFSVLK